MTKIIVYHGSYGCATGCCGHVVEVVEPGDDLEVGEHFHFAHPYDDDPLEFAKELVRDEFGSEHVADLAWDECEVSDE